MKNEYRFWVLLLPLTLLNMFVFISKNKLTNFENKIWNFLGLQDAGR